MLGNVGPDEPFGGGVPGIDFDVADPATTGQVLQFRVVPITALDPTTPPESLVLPPVPPLPVKPSPGVWRLSRRCRRFFDDAPAEAELGTIEWDSAAGVGTWRHFEWRAPVTENPAIGATQIWELLTSLATLTPATFTNRLRGREPAGHRGVRNQKQVQINPVSPPTPPEPWETGFKDTVTAYPGQVTRVRAQFKTPGRSSGIATSSSTRTMK